MPLPVADEGMPLFPQPQGLRGSANADPQTLTRQGGKRVSFCSTCLPSPTSLRSATSPKGRGKGCLRSNRQSVTAKMPQKKRRHSPAQHIQAERHVRSAVCLLPTIAMQRNCRSYFIVKSKRQNASGGQKNTTKTTESAVSLYLAFLCKYAILEARVTS